MYLTLCVCPGMLYLKHFVFLVTCHFLLSCHDIVCRKYTWYEQRGPPVAKFCGDIIVMLQPSVSKRKSILCCWFIKQNFTNHTFPITYYNSPVFKYLLVMCLHEISFYINLIE